MNARQLGLLEPAHSGFDAAFTGIKRTTLEFGAWLDYAQGWLGDHNALFEALVRDTAWQNTEQHLFDRKVATPRLVADLAEGQLPELVAAMQQALSTRYNHKFQRVSLALYRDGRDSVAFHGDRIARELPDALVATVSLGAPRRFVLRPHPDMHASEPRRSLTYNLGWGDLLVMGGSCQRTWQHAIPKVRSAQPRIAMMFRPVWEPQR